MLPYVANELVIPNLHEFHTKHPDINLIVETSAALEDSELDAAIRFGIPLWGNLNSELICRAQSGLLVSSSYLQHNPINDVEDLQTPTLIHSRIVNGGTESIYGCSDEKW
jgi:DNA-binding transcriptional LysR family regulator